MLLLESPKEFEKRFSKKSVSTSINSSYDSITLDISRSGVKKVLKPGTKDKLQSESKTTSLPVQTQSSNVNSVQKPPEGGFKIKEMSSKFVDKMADRLINKILDFTI